MHSHLHLIVPRIEGSVKDILGDGQYHDKIKMKVSEG